jgi:hypothetical protein
VRCRISICDAVMMFYRMKGDDGGEKVLMDDISMRLRRMKMLQTTKCASLHGMNRRIGGLKFRPVLALLSSTM